MKKKIVVTGAVFLRNNRVLAAKRGEGKALAGFWEFPGGKVEANETPEEALARELKEELLVTATVGRHVTTTEHEYDFGTIVLSTYFCELDSAEPQLTEHAEIRWVTTTEMLELDWAPADIPAVQTIINLLD